MDSLIVLRKPLRRAQLEPKSIIPKKSKKAVPKVDPIPPDPDLGEKLNEPPISFVKLYKDLCVENSISATSRIDATSPTRLRMCSPARVFVNSTHVDLNPAAGLDVNSPDGVYVSPTPQFECPPGHLHVNTPESRTEASRSDTSLATHYFGTEVQCSRVFTDVPARPPSSARAELILELDYDTSSKDSGFC